MPYTLQKDSIYQYDSQNKWDGAVVFLFVEDSIFLIQRSNSMPTHAGQVAFVGGHKKDGENPVETAKREFIEETSLDASLLEELQILEPQFTSNQNIIYPVLAKIKMSKVKFLNSIKSNGEWDNAYLIPMDYIFDESHWSRAEVVSVKKYDIYFCPIPKSFAMSQSTLDERGVVLWGATAKMIWNFFKKHIDSAKNE